MRYTLSSIRAPRIGTRGGYPRRSMEDMKKMREQEPKDDGKDGQGGGGKRRRNRGKKTAAPQKDEWSTEHGQPDQYLAREAKEFVRALCIGKEVRLVFEYERDMMPQRRNRGGAPPQTKKRFGTIFVQNAKGDEVNVALELMNRGMCELVWHSKN